MKNFLLVIGFVFAATQVQAQIQIHTQAESAIGSVGLDLTPFTVGYVHLTTVVLTGADKDSVLKKFDFKATDAVVLVGVKYTIKDSVGGTEEGYVWSKAVFNATTDLVNAALEAPFDQSLLAPIGEAYKNKLASKQANPATRVDYPANSVARAPENKVKKGDSKLEVILIGATWCPVCVKAQKVIASFGDQYKDFVIFHEYDRDSRGDMVQKYNAVSVPTMVFEVNGKIIKKVDGAYTDDLKAVIDQYIRLGLIP